MRQTMSKRLMQKPLLPRMKQDALRAKVKAGPEPNQAEATPLNLT